MERAKRSGGLHKRSAEDWGHGLRARGAELPLEGLEVAFRETCCGQDRPAEAQGCVLPSGLAIDRSLLDGERF